MSKYFCKCGHDQFTLERRKTQGAWGRVTSDVLICAQCKECYYIDPCNANGLQTQKRAKQIQEPPV